MLRPQNQKYFTRKLSFNFFKNWGKTCEKLECTKPMEIPEKYVVEKSCAPCIFAAWKPKKPDLTCLPSIKAEMMKTYTAKKCQAGMKVPGKSKCDAKIEARECQKVNHPKWLKFCPSKPKYQDDGPQPLLRAALVQCRKNKGKMDKKDAMGKTPPPKSMRKKCTPQIPKADWNHDGFMS